MNHRRDEQYGRQQFGRHNEEFQDERDRDRDGNDRSLQMQGGRGQDDWRRDSDRSGWGRIGGDQERFGGYGYGAGYGYGEGARGGYSYSPPSQRRWVNEGLSGDFSIEGTRNFARDERRARVSHRGKGPKGYKRSDDRIREEVCQILADHHDIDASEIEVVVKEGEVTLSGTVGDRHTKRLAERVIENLSGVVDVHNQVRVVRAEASAQPSAASAPSAPVASGRSNGNQTPPSTRSH